jgi:uncharacterized protein
MSESKGRFAWYELMTTDTAAAGKFYASVVGWTTHEMDGGGMKYTTFNLGEVGMAGMLTIPEEAKSGGTPNSWIGYIHVDNVDAFIPKVTAAGGRLYKPATDVPGMLRFAVMADSGGAAFIIFTPNPAMPSPARPLPPALGTISWHELYAADLEPAWTFYTSLFGWTKVAEMDMGPSGPYRLFDQAEGLPMGSGGMMNKAPQMPVPSWAFYFQVDSATAALERIKAGGGVIANGPIQVPGGGWIVQAIDPQGAYFNVVSSNE